jgi:NAD(P)H-flavin reductase
MLSISVETSELLGFVLSTSIEREFHTEFRDLAAKSGAEALKIKSQFDAYLPLYDREDTALKKIVKSEFTAKIHEADKARDEIYAGMVEMNAAALKHFSPQIRDDGSINNHPNRKCANLECWRGCQPRRGGIRYRHIERRDADH